MANRYWVGGTASWDGTAGTKWAATSGAAGGETVPTTADDVFFDAASGANTVTIATGNTGAKSINCTGFTGTLTGTAGIDVAGSITLVAGQTYTHTGVVTVTGTGTLTTAGKPFSALTVDGSGITLTLGDALGISTRSITLNQGTFDTANYSVTAGQITSTTSNTRAVILGSSTVTLSSASAFVFVATNLTVSAGTSQINVTSASARIEVIGVTFHNVSFTSTAAGTRSIIGANTFNNLTLTASATGLSQLSVSANQTVNGTLTCAGLSGIERAFVRSDTIGTSRTLTVATLSANDCDFRDITIAGGAAGTSPTRAGDCGGNSGITFPAAKTVYRVGTSTTWQGSSSWALISGGAGSNNNFPLAQDTAVINEDTAFTGTINHNGTYNVGTTNFSNRTTGITINFGAGCNLYGSLIFSSAVTVSGTSTQTFSGRGTMVLTSAGKTWAGSIEIDAPSGTLELGDAFSGSQGITLTRGTFDAKNYAVTCLTFTSNNTNTRTLTMGSGLWTISGTGNVWNTGSATGMTLNKDTADILLSNNSTTARAFNGALFSTLSFNKLTIGGATSTSITTITGANTFTELASTKTVAHTVTFTAYQNTFTTWSISGSAGNVVTVNSDSVGTRRTFTLTNVTSGIDYLNVKDIGITDTNRFYVGVNSTDGGNNLNVYFTAAPSLSTGNMLFMFR